LEWEEGSVLSLAYAHYQLGTVDSVVDDFAAVLNRAISLQRYDNLPDLLILAGRINFAEGEIDSTIDMLEYALVSAWVLDGELFRQFESHSDKPEFFQGLQDVVAYIYAIVRENIELETSKNAKTLYDGLIERLRTHDIWEEIGSIVIQMLEPLGEYLKAI
jgi:hypothetical protein